MPNVFKKSAVFVSSFIVTFSAIGEAALSVDLDFAPGYVQPSTQIGYINGDKVEVSPLRLLTLDTQNSRNLSVSKLNALAKIQQPTKKFEFVAAQSSLENDNPSILESIRDLIPGLGGAKPSILGLFNVSEHFVCAPQTPCARREDLGFGGAALTRGAGGGLVFEYLPYFGLGADSENYQDPYPTGIFSDYSWIQTVTYENAFGFEELIDVGPSDFPIYQSVREENTEFYDRSYRAGFPYLARGQNLWKARVHLAQYLGLNRETDTRRYRIYDGLEWGWVAELNQNPPCPSGCKEDSPPSPQLPAISDLLKTFGVYEPISYNAPNRTTMTGVKFVDGYWNAWDPYYAGARQNCPSSLSALDSNTRLFTEFDSLYIDNSGPGCEYKISLKHKGGAQDDPLLPDSEDDDWKKFYDAPSGLWYDPPAKEGLEFQALNGTLFTDIYDFPIGLDVDNLFTVSVNDMTLGQFSPGERLNFASLFGSGVSSFKITGLHSLFSTKAVDYPFRLAFNGREGDFRVRAFEDGSKFEDVKQTPEPGTTITIAILGTASLFIPRKKKVDI
jgi:hypothetical protein